MADGSASTLPVLRWEMSRLTWFATALITLLCVPGLSAQSQRSEPKTFDFGTVGLEEDWQHTFEFENKGSVALEIKDVNLTPPLVVTKMPVRIPPGQRGSFAIRMETPRDNGDFRGAVVVNFKGEGSEPLVIRVIGKVVRPIEFDPMPVFFLSTQRGQPKTASIELVNNESDPFEIMRVENSSTRFAVEAETLEPGRRYRLSLTMKGDGPAGRMVDTITVVTSSRAHPFIEVRANTNLNERVHAFPDAIDFGSISTASLKSGSQAAEALSTSLMVYQEEGKDFRIIAETDVPFLRLSVSQADLKDRYEIRLTLVPEKLRSGPVNGTVVILSNDQEFPRMTIPVKAMIEGSW